MNETLKDFYSQVADLWKKLCEEHSILFDYTFDEYALLLGSEIEKMEKLLKDKNAVVERIKNLDNQRKELMEQINEKIPHIKVTNIKELLSVMKEYEPEMKGQKLSKLNALLKDIIKKIKTQNKRNQLFINKAIISLREIRQEALGKKKYSTYNAKGMEGQKDISL